MGQLDLDGEAIVESLCVATVVVDDDGTIRGSNDAFTTLVEPEEVCGRTATDVLDGRPELLTSVRDRAEDTVAVEGDETRYYRVRVSPVDNQTPDGESAHLFQFHDVTDLRRKQERLERQNEQLDKFASLISHDLRNPLDVAIGRTTILREMTDDTVAEHLEELDAAHARMRQIIKDVLTLARHGESIDEKEPVPLPEAAMRAWSHVDTDAASLSLTASQSVRADPERLEQVFENLFRNSVEHGTTETDAPVTVTVGTLTDRDGFYVADDGSGIPEEKHDAVLEPGISSDEGNTGLGLAIVRKLTEAHGWELAVTASESGGARFEFVGVEGVDD